MFCNVFPSWSVIYVDKLDQSRARSISVGRVKLFVLFDACHFNYRLKMLSGVLRQHDRH